MAGSNSLLSDGDGATGDAQLLADVRDFVAQLGLSSNGGAASFGNEFADFAPAKAKKKLSKSNDNDGTEGTEKKEIKRPKQKLPETNIEPQSRAIKAAVSPPEAPQPRSRRDKDGAPPKSLLKSGEEGMWYELAADLPQPHTGTGIASDDATVMALREAADRLLDAEARCFEAASGRQRNGSTLQWFQQAQRAGTTSDKVAAMAVLVQESPIANLRALDGLITMAGKRGGARAVVGTALDALRELWIDVLLPSDRKLRFLGMQPLGERMAGRSGDRALLFWGFEDSLKRRYAEFLEALDNLTRDNLEFVKDRAIKTAFDLLMARPEGEAALLSTLVNKLGDPSRKLASKVGYLLRKLLATHPGMKTVVVREVERFAFRPGLTDRARYYAVVFLNQMVLNHNDKSNQNSIGKNSTASSLARRLIDVYFTLFKLVMEGRVGTAASLAAAAREKSKREAEARAARRGKKKATAKKLNDGKVAEGEGSDGDQAGGERTGEMDSRMLSALITGVRRAFPYVASEEVEPLIEAHADALFRLVHTGSIGVATQALLLLHQLMTSRNSVSDRFYRALYAVTASPDLSNSTKAPMFLALLFKALKADVSPRRVAAFFKRLLQVAAESPPGFACGCLFLVSEMLKSRPAGWNAVLQPEDHDDGDGIEHFKDAGADTVNEKDVGTLATARLAADAAHWPGDTGYDPRKREPQYSNADKSCLWELLPLAAHVHPSVAAMARTLLAGMPISYDGDPLRDFTLGAFLDKFIQKKAKLVLKGDSLMQPLRSGTAEVTDEGVAAALKLASDREVAPDEAFFHRYYSLAAEVGSKKKAKKNLKADEELLSDGENASSDESDAIDDFLAGEEGGGEEGIGADPDQSTDYDYSKLVEAMEELSDDKNSNSDYDDSAVSLEGAEFSDLSDGGSEGYEGEGDGMEDPSTLSEDNWEEGSLIENSSDSEFSDEDGEDDEAADAEVAALLAQAEKSRNSGEASGSDDEVDPFALAEASEDEVDEEVNDSEDSGDDWGSGLDDDDVQSDLEALGGGDVFAAADDYDDVIIRDLAGEVTESEANEMRLRIAGVRGGKKTLGKRSGGAVVSKGKKARR